MAEKKTMRMVDTADRDKLQTDLQNVVDEFLEKYDNGFPAQIAVGDLTTALAAWAALRLGVKRSKFKAALNAQWELLLEHHRKAKAAKARGYDA